MKRFFPVALILALLCTGMAMAESVSLEKTEKRNLVEFLELYAKLKIAIRSEETDEEETDGVITPDYLVKQTGADFLLETSEGTIWANKNTLNISRMEFPIMHMWFDDNDNYNSEDYTHNAMLTFAALEYGTDYNAGDYYSQNGFDSNIVSFVMASSTFGEYFLPPLSDELIHLVGEDKSRAIYSGNYDYFLQGKRNEQGTDVLLYYVAVAR